MILTSRYSNPELGSGDYTAVRISIGTPRWRLGYTLAGEITELMPWGLRGISDMEIFKAQYTALLNEVGVDKIAAKLRHFEGFGKPTVLLCYEDIRKGGDNWCHRTMFAQWWFKQTGEEINELVDNSKFVPAKKK